jgi:hypothetical protein
MQIPSNMLISSKHVRPSIYMGLCMMTWALVSACTALVHNYAGLLACRFSLADVYADSSWSKIHHRHMQNLTYSPLRYHHSYVCISVALCEYQQG